MGFHLSRGGVPASSSRAFPGTIQVWSYRLVLWLEIPQALRYVDSFFFNQTKPESELPGRFPPNHLKAMGVHRQKSMSNASNGMGRARLVESSPNQRMNPKMSHGEKYLAHRSPSTNQVPESDLCWGGT